MDAGLEWTTLTFVSLVAVASMLAPEQWMTLVMGVNVIASALTAVLLVALVRRLTQSAAAAASALLLYLACFDLVLWVRFVLTDIVYSAIALAVFTLVADGLLGPRIAYRRLLLCMAIAAALLTRPVAIVLVPLVLFAELILGRTAPRGRTLVVAGVLAIAVVTSARAYVVHDPARWPFALAGPAVTAYSAREKSGEVVWDRPETARRPPLTMSDHVLQQFDRSARFFQFTASTYSPAHNLMNAGYYLLLYALALGGVFDAMRGADARRRSVVLAALVWVLSYALYHGMTLLDFDWRYRIPLMPLIVLMSACGVDALTRRYNAPRAA